MSAVPVLGKGWGSRTAVGLDGQSPSLTFCHRQNTPLFKLVPLPSLGIFSAEMSKNSIFKGVEVVWNVGCATELGSRDSHLAASTTCWEHVAPAWKSCMVVCNLSGWSDPLFTDQSVNINNSKWIKCSGKGGWEENCVIETECLKKTINTLSHFYSLQYYFFSVISHWMPRGGYWSFTFENLILVQVVYYFYMPWDPCGPGVKQNQL